MKTTYYISIFLILLTGIVSCGKNKTTTVSGRLMQSCDTPAANREGSIITSDGLLTGAGEILFFKSDENGYFEATYTGRKSITSFRVSVQGKGDVLRVTHLEGKKKELGDVYIFPPSVSYYLYLDVDSSYTASDTLTYYDWGYPQNGATHWVKRLAGPFESGIIDTVHFALNLNGLPVNYNSEPNKLNINYGISAWNEKLVRIPTPHCQEEYQTVTLVID